MIYANVLQPLIDVFEGVLKFFHDSIGFGWGTAIIALTVTIRAALLPLAVKQFRSMQALQRIAPQLKQLQEKYKEDKQRLQQETMKFYQEHKVNPFASCLPLLAQLPVFISLFYMPRKDLRHDICPDINPAGTPNPKPCGASSASEFWFIPDITDKATGAVLVALIVMYVGSQLVSSLLMMTATTDKNQRTIMLVLPFLFVPFVFSFPAGLLVYWITTNVWTIGQQQFLRRVVGKNLPPAPQLTPDDGSKPSPRGGGGAGRNGGGEDKEPVAARAAKAPPPPPRARKKKKTGRRR
ncbi:MAG: membrane protein insertase YidC [Solirubrobacterales bacterium]|nr:membrane protein insertase YidC [Solirubrobacterales bacterium]